MGIGPMARFIQIQLVLTMLWGAKRHEQHLGVLTLPCLPPLPQKKENSQETEKKKEERNEGREKEGGLLSNFYFQAS